MNFLFLLNIFMIFMILTSSSSSSLIKTNQTNKEIIKYSVDIFNIILEYSSFIDLLKTITINKQFKKHSEKTRKFIEFVNEINKNQIENQNLWKEVIQLNDIKMLKEMKSFGFKMTLSNDELIKIIKSFNSVSYYETIEFILEYVDMDVHFAMDLIFISFNRKSLRTPNNKKQQNSQFNIVQNLIKHYPVVKEEFKHQFYEVIESLNIALFNLYIDLFSIGINRLYYGCSVLQLIVNYLINYPNKNNKVVYEMFDHLLAIGADIKQKDSKANDIYFYINIITDHKIKENLNEIIKKHANQKTFTKEKEELKKIEDIQTKVIQKLSNEKTSKHIK